jgi:hypothetical protein
MDRESKATQYIYYSENCHNSIAAMARIVAPRFVLDYSKINYFFVEALGDHLYTSEHSSIILLVTTDWF